MTPGCIISRHDFGQFCWNCTESQTSRDLVTRACSSWGTILVNRVGVVLFFCSMWDTFVLTCFGAQLRPETFGHASPIPTQTNQHHTHMQIMGRIATRSATIFSALATSSFRSFTQVVSAIVVQFPPQRRSSHVHRPTSLCVASRR